MAKEVDPELELEAIKLSSHYAFKLDNIAKCLSSGIFQLAMARKQNKLIASAENIRSDLDAMILVEESEISLTDDESRSLFPAFILKELEPKSDPILLLSGLPPPALKLSQCHFRDAIKEIIELAIIRNKIDSLLEKNGL